ncbi:MAG: serine hydroxymethyltransferase, partial [Oceanococcaceae bacterium]
SPVNFSGKMYRPVAYQLDPETGELNYDTIRELALAEKPKMILGGFSAYSRVVDWARLRAIADEVGAKLFVDMAHVAGLVAAGEYPSPLPHAHVVTTTTHKTLRGPRGGLILSACGDEDLYKKLNSAVFPGQQGGPLMHVIAAKAVAFGEALRPEFKSYQQQVVRNARAMADVVRGRGYDVVSGGTDNHLFLLSLRGLEVTGKDAEEALGQAHITLNKNSVPNDDRSPFVTSGLRIGSPAATTRGFAEAEMRTVATWICDILDALQKGDAAAEIARVRGEAEALCARFPVYA